MSETEAEKAKPSFLETIRSVWGPYKRIYSYVKPYRGRFALGLGFGIAFGGVSSLIPLVVAKVSSVIFHGAAPNPRDLVAHRELLTLGPKINSIAVICLAIPVVMIARGFCDYANTYFMTWVSNRVVMDIRNQLFSKVVRQSMDFFNRVRSGFLMSRISNDTRSMQGALTTVSSDLFKQPVTAVGAIAVLLLMDWRFTLVTLVLFPVCLIPIQFYGRRARTSVRQGQRAMGQMSATMQETFAGIRVIKSFGREKHQEKSFQRGSQLQFSNAMRTTKATEATGPLVEIIASLGVGLTLLYVYLANLSAARFLGLILGFFILYDPIKKLSKIHVLMQRSLAATTEIFAILDSTPSVQDAPSATALPSSRGPARFRGCDIPVLQCRRRRRAGLEFAHRTRKNVRTGRTERRRQKHHPVADPATVRSDGGRGENRRPRFAQGHPGIVARANRSRHPGNISISRHDFPEHPVWPAGRDAGGSLRRGADCLRARLHHGAA